MSHGRSRARGHRHAGARRGLTLGQQIALVGLVGGLVAALLLPGLLVLM